jgi:hypothetical protein
MVRPCSAACAARCSSARDTFEAGFRPHRAPIRENANDARAGALRDFERAVREARLIREGVGGGEHVLLKRASTSGESGRTHFSKGEAMETISRPWRATISLARSSSIAQVDDVLAEYHAQFGAGHADFRHGADCGFEVLREFVGDGRDGKELSHCCKACHLASHAQ